MRRLMLLVAVGILGSLAGCKLIHSHGVCDCEDDDHCYTRAPWIRLAPPTSAPTEAIPTPPTKMPDGKKL